MICWGDIYLIKCNLSRYSSIRPTSQSVNHKLIEYHYMPGIMENTLETEMKNKCTVPIFLKVRILTFFKLLRKLSQICPKISLT